MCEVFRHVSMHEQTHTPARARKVIRRTYARDSQVHRLTALSKKCFTDGSFPFFFRLTDLSAQLRWCPICLCTFKIHTQTPTYCLHKETHAQGRNSIKCLPFKFHFWSPWLLLPLPHPPSSLPPSLWPRADLSSCSLTSFHFLIQQPRTPLPGCISSFSPPLPLLLLPPRLYCSPSDHAPRCAQPTLSSAADGWAAHACRQAITAADICTLRHNKHTRAYKRTYDHTGCQVQNIYSRSTQAQMKRLARLVSHNKNFGFKSSSKPDRENLQIFLIHRAIGV